MLYSIVLVLPYNNVNQLCKPAKLLQACPTLRDPMDCSLPCSYVHEISRQEYWRGLQCPPPRDLPDPVMEPMAPAFQADSLPLSHWGSPESTICIHISLHS